MEWNLDTSEQGEQPFASVCYISIICRHALIMCRFEAGSGVWWGQYGQRIEFNAEYRTTPSQSQMLTNNLCPIQKLCISLWEPDMWILGCRDLQCISDVMAYESGLTGLLWELRWSQETTCFILGCIIQMTLIILWCWVDVQVQYIKLLTPFYSSS